MVVLRVSSHALLAWAGVALALGATDRTLTASKSSVIKGKFIIEVDPASALSKRDTSPEATLGSVLDGVKHAGIDFSVSMNFTQAPELFHGASISVSESTTVEDILSVPGVLKVFPVRKYSLPSPVDPSSASEIATNAQNELGKRAPQYDMSEMEADSMFEDFEAPELAKRATTKNKYATDTFSPHKMTGVDKMHKKGYLGKGVKIGIIDTGLDYKNPILGGCFGKGCHISFGYDLVGDSYDGSNTPKGDKDPYASCQVHGTHVTGIIGALPNAYGFTGVAPEATIGHYRVFGCSPSGYVGDDVIVAAITRAYNDKVDIVSLSLGEPVGYLSSTAPQALVEKLTAKGVFFSSATGNEGAEGLMFAEAPADTRVGTAVASVDVKELPAFKATIVGHGSLTYLSPATGPLVAAKELEVYFTSTDVNDDADACEALPKSLDLKNKIVVVQRGTCYFVTKETNVASRGGAYMLVYNSATGTQMPVLDATGTGLVGGAGAITHAQGLSLLKLYKAGLKSGKKLKMTFNKGALVPGLVDTLTGGTVSTFSNFGPSGDLIGQPSLSAPGGNIFSTLPRDQGSVGILSGTSMATPFISGSAALLLSARKSEKLTPAQVRAILSSTAKQTTTLIDNKGARTTVLQQGGGLVQVDEAIAAKTIVSPNEISLNDTAFGVYEQTVSFKNLNKVPVTYSFSSVLGQTLGLYQNGSQDVLPNTLPEEVKGATASIVWAQKSVTVAAGKTGSVKVTINPPQLTAAQASKFPFFSGWLRITGKGKGTTQEFSVPYFGLANKVSAIPVLDTTSTVYGAGHAYPFIANPSTNAVQMTDAAVYTFANGPYYAFRLASACRFLSWTLVDADVVLGYSPTIATNNNGGTASHSKRNFSHSHFEKRSGPWSGEHDGRVGVAALPRMKTKRAALAHQAASTLTILASASGFTTYGTVYYETDEFRDYLVSSEGTMPFTDSVIQFTGEYTNNAGVDAKAVAGKKYRLLLRALKTTADPSKESSYESWLSPSFSFSA